MLTFFDIQSHRRVLFADDAIVQSRYD